MKERFLIIGILSLLTVIQARGSSSLDSMLNVAHEAFSNGHYEQALKTYQEVLAQGEESADLYYNLGNAYFKSEDIPHAIYYWEKALKLNPRHQDAEYNLRLANTMIDDKINPLPEFFLKRWYESILFSINPIAWRWLALVLAIITALLFALVIFKGWRTVLMGMLISATLTIVLVGLSWHSQYLLNSQRSAIVFTPTVTVMSSPDEAGTQLFVIHQGTKVKVTDELRDWYRIRIADGNEGWLKKSDVAEF